MKNKKGQTLIEVIAALSAAVVVVSAITVAVITALSNAEFSKSQNQATQYAQQGMELVRSMRNNSYGMFAQLQGTYCLDKSCTGIDSSPGGICGPKSGQYSCGTNIDSFFVREITVEQTSPVSSGCNQYAYKVTSTVYWKDGKCTSALNNYCHSISLSSCLSDYNVVPTP